MTTINQTIIDQMGGNVFFVMTGSKFYEETETAVTFVLKKNHSKANRFTIEYDTAMDWYSIRFWHYKKDRLDTKTGRYHEPQSTTINEYEGVYFDQLQELFTQETGFYTSL